MIWYVVSQKNGVSALGLQRTLGFQRYETIWIMLHKLRIAMVRPDRERLSGVVEVDETYIGGKGQENEVVEHPVNLWFLSQLKIKKIILGVFAFSGC